MATKNNPGKFDCLANAEPDEPMFVLLARDPLAPVLVRLWAEMRTMRGLNPWAEDKFKEAERVMEKTKEARDCAEAMEKWAEAHGDSPSPIACVKCGSEEDVEFLKGQRNKPYHCLKCGWRFAPGDEKVPVTEEDRIRMLSPTDGPVPH